MSEFKGILYHWGKHMKPKVVELVSASPSLLVLDVGDKRFSLTCWSGSISSPFVVSSWRTYDHEERYRSVFNCKRINPDGGVVCTFQFSARECRGFVQAIQPDDPPKLPTPVYKYRVMQTSNPPVITRGVLNSDGCIELPNRCALCPSATSHWYDTPQRAMDAWLDQWDFENARRIVARNDMVLKLIKQVESFA